VSGTDVSNPNFAPLMSLIVDVLVLVLWVGAGTKLEADARKHLKDPNKVYWASPLWSPEEYTEYGNLLRVRALRFWVLGLLGILAYAIVF
jgi:hypothetical protein